MRSLMSCLLCLTFVGAAQGNLLPAAWDGWTLDSWNVGSNYFSGAEYYSDTNEEWVGEDYGAWALSPQVAHSGGRLQYSFDYATWLSVLPQEEGYLVHLRFFDADGVYVGEEIVEEITNHTGFGWESRSGTVPAMGTHVAVYLSNGVHNDFNGAVKVKDITLVEDFTAAWGPTPENGVTEAGISPDGVTVTVELSWHTRLDPENPSTYDPNVVTHYLYMSADQSLSNDANLILIDSIAASGATSGMTVTNLNFDGLYLWRVDEGIDDGTGTAYLVGDPNNIIGDTWVFSAMSSRPVIITQPVSILANAGDDAAFTVEAESLTDAYYQWYKSADAIIDTTVDQPIGSPGTDGTLTLMDVQISDEAYYYCQVYNDSGIEKGRYSDVVTLGIRRQVAHWTLDAADYSVVGEEAFYLDSSGEGNDASVGGDPIFVDGIVTGDQNPNNLLTNGAVHFNQDNGWANAGTWNPAKFSNQFTISTWFKWEQTGDADYNTIVAKRDDWGFNSMMFMLHLHAPTARIIMETPGGGWVGGPENSVQPNQWYHVAAVYDAGGPTRLYLNGQWYAEIAGYTMGNPNATFWIGRNNVISERFGGVLDDLQVFNHTLDQTTVVDLYNAETGEAICLWDGRPTMDLSGDCKVGLEDFTMLAAEWLEHNWYPFVP